MAQHDPFMGVGDVEAPTPAPAPKKPERLLSLDERKALNWFKANTPASSNAKGLPNERKRYDPISYSITGKGIEETNQRPAGAPEPVYKR